MLFNVVAGIVAGGLVLLLVTAAQKIYRVVKPAKPKAG
jgi:hypothetical protein